MTDMSFKLTGTERSWVLYDVGNSAFTLMLLLSTIIPIYFNSIAGEDLSSVDYLAYWGYAASIATVLVALMGPFLGAVSDRKGKKIRMFSCVLAIGVIGCAALGFVNQWLVFLIVLVITRLGYSLSLVFYDSMLVDVSSPQSMHTVSAMGYAWGYIGSCVPFVVCLVLILGCDSFGITMGSAMTISLVIIAAWWVVFTIPLIRRYRQTHYVDGRESSLNAFRMLATTLGNARSEKKAFMFLIAFFFFIDGVYTIIEMATAYGQALGLDTTMLLVALLVTQVVAFPCTIAFGRLAQGRNVVRLLMVCILAYACITVYASAMDRRHPGHVQVVLLKDHSPGEVRGVLRTHGHLRQGGLVHGNLHGLRHEPAHRQHVHGDTVPGRPVHSRTPGPGSRLRDARPGALPEVLVLVSGMPDPERCRSTEPSA